MEAALVSSETDSEQLPARIPLHIELSFIILTFFSYSFTDINECDNNNGNCTMNSNCVNKLGFFECQCHKGYEIMDGECMGWYWFFIALTEYRLENKESGFPVIQQNSKVGILLALIWNGSQLSKLFYY